MLIFVIVVVIEKNDYDNDHDLNVLEHVFYTSQMKSFIGIRIALRDRKS